MRLLEAEVFIIKKVLHSFCKEGEIYLHGSRIDDKAKGGDIDLFFVIPDGKYEELISKKHFLESELSAKLSDQKIDIVCLSQNDGASHSFFVNSHKIKL